MAKDSFSQATLDDILRDVINEIFKRGETIFPTKGEAREISGVLLEITNPLARLSRTETRGRIFSALGELCWYLAGSRRVEFIAYYIKEYLKIGEECEIHGAYCPRLFKWRGVNQISNVINILRQKSNSRQAVIQLFDAHDVSERHEDVPCTCTLQFMQRDRKVYLIVNMRSNDVHWGLPHDVFCFTMLQEIIAKSLKVEVGTYKHFVGSLHLYVKHTNAAKGFLKEGFQRTSPVMPPMPTDDPWPSIGRLLKAESAIRNGEALDESQLEGVDAYWVDFVRLLQLYAIDKLKSADTKVEAAIAVQEKMSPAYRHFTERFVRRIEVRK